MNNNTYYTMAPTFPNPYISRKLNNMEEARMMKEERNDWTKMYHKILKGLEAMIDVQKQVRDIVTNFIQLVSPQQVNRFSQTKLLWKAPNKGYPHICGMYKSNNKQLRYQAISSYKSFVC